ncbi:hypothetical protein Hrd1104_10545 [Halorhabdus sp. CBA1104]|uniref:hypothetical protein n=1 Tax=Halorhabdus sp. CBA1104 TaxID=1380432 RepID=UPI0012B37346|nr:hypothetical protein [Halorhabdus sp. CBA1104]QGN07693.1 hypothetical protein Hrd1104_10545 [Halorhabdus sp. CBA1104]
MEFRDDVLVIDKPPNDLDRLVLEVTDVLEDCGVEYAVVSGYVTVLLGRSRATEDIDVIVSPFDEPTAGELADRLLDAGFWGPNTPLAAMYSTLADELPVRIARDGDLVPNVELKFATDQYDRTSIAETVTVEFEDDTLTIGALELQIAYKLRLGTEKDFEDALHLYETTKGSLNIRRLEEHVEDLDVENAYDRLRDA